jgi:hypothetical protein
MKVRMEDEMDVKSGRGPGSANRGVFRRDDAHLWGSKQIGKPCFVASSRSLYVSPLAFSSQTPLLH